MTINKQDVCWTSQIRFSTPFILGALRPESSFKRVGMELDASPVVLERRFPYAQSTTEHCSLFFCSYRIWSVGRSGGDWGGLHVLLHTGMWRVSPPPSRCRTGSSRSPALLADGSDLPFFSGFLTVQHFCGEHLVLRYGLQMKFSFHLNHGSGPCFYLLIPGYGFQNIIDVFISYLSIETWDNGLLTIDTGDKIYDSRQDAMLLYCGAGALQQCKFMWSLIVSLLTFYFAWSSRN